MTDRRQVQRFRAEILVDFTPSELKTTGITYDVSFDGMFVRTSRLPAPGQKLLTTLRFPDGKQLLTQGQVVRVFYPSPLLRGLLPIGFGINIRNNESYRRFVSKIESATKAPVAVGA